MQRSILCLLLPLLTACLSKGEPFDPTVIVSSDGGEELGVATPYGVVFLGHRASGPSVELMPAFGDGPAFELAPAIEVAPSLKLAFAEITLPSVPLDFDAPRPGSTVLVRGRVGRNAWQESVDVAKVSTANGILLQNDGAVRKRIANGMVGAGVYREDGDGHLHLLGLVDGQVSVGGRTYIAVAGAGHLWPILTYDRTIDRKRWVYRDDVL